MSNNTNIQSMTETAQRIFEAAHLIIESMRAWELEIVSRSKS